MGDRPFLARIGEGCRAAAASWYLVEEPIRRWRSRLEHPTPAREPARPEWARHAAPAMYSPVRPV